MPTLDASRSQNHVLSLKNKRSTPTTTATMTNAYSTPIAGFRIRWSLPRGMSLTTQSSHREVCGRQLSAPSRHLIFDSLPGADYAL